MRKIDNKIKESFCSFEISKLLKEKGFNIDTDNGWVLMNGEYHWNNRFFTYDIPQPTHSIAKKWLYANFQVELLVLPQNQSILDPYPRYFMCVLKYENGDMIELINTSNDHNKDTFKHYNNICEGEEAGLLFILKNI